MQLPNEPIPEATEVEKVLIGTMIRDHGPLARLVVSLLTPDDFYLPSHRLLFRMAREVTEAGIDCDLLTFCQYLEDQNVLDDAGGRGYVAGLDDLYGGCSEADVRHYASLVKEKANRRRLIHFAYELGTRAYNQREPVPAQLYEQAGIAPIPADGQAFPEDAEFPPHPALEPPELLKPLIHGVSEFTYTDPFTVLMAAFSFVGCLIDDRVDFVRYQHRPRFFTLLVGAPGSGKGHAMTICREKIIPAPFFLTSLRSGEGIAMAHRKAKEAGHRALIAILSEFSTVLEAGSRSQSTLLSVLCDLYESNTVRSSLAKSFVSLDQVGFSMIGGITPDKLQSEAMQFALDAGLFSRFLLVPAPRHTADRTDRYDLIPSLDLTHTLDHLAAVPFTPDADAALAALPERKNPRAKIIASRLAVVHAVLDQRHSVTTKDIDWVAPILPWQEEFAAQIAPLATDSKVVRAEEAIRRTVERLKSAGLRSIPKSSASGAGLYQKAHMERHGVWAFNCAISNLHSIGFLFCEHPESPSAVVSWTA